MPSAEWRRKNPIHAAYLNKKSNAKKRGIPFMLTLEEWTEFCIATDYVKSQAETRTAYHVDRIDNNKGYTIDNIELITAADNVRKQWTVDYTAEYCPKEKRMKFYSRKNKKQKQDFQWTK